MIESILLGMGCTSLTVRTQSNTRATANKLFETIIKCPDGVLSGDFMRRRRLLALELALGISLVLGGAMFRIAFAQSSPPPEDDRGPLVWRAREAAKAGKKSITISAPMITVAEIKPLNDTLVHTSAVVAELVATATTHDKYNIVTWRKYRLLEKLSTQQSSVSSDPLPNEVPHSLLPLKTNEFVLPELGGTVIIDGVTITMCESEGELPAGRHLLFVLFRSSGSLAVANYGPRGIFWIDKTDNIHARVESDNNWLHSVQLVLQYCGEQCRPCNSAFPSFAPIHNTAPALQQ